MSLEMKYFVLKPKSKYKNDPWAMASRAAMRTFADMIAQTDPDIAWELKAWVDKEDKRSVERIR